MNYHTLKNQLDELIGVETNFIANAANFASLLFYSLENINWAGFYIFDGKELVLGPFCGKTACIRIALGRGVCGSAASHKRTYVVDDVHSFPGHIPCDAASNSEMVIPLLKKGMLYGVLDIDSPVLSRFSYEDKGNIEQMADILVQKSDMDKLEKYYF